MCPIFLLPWVSINYNKIFLLENIYKLIKEWEEYFKLLPRMIEVWQIQLPESIMFEADGCLCGGGYIHMCVLMCVYVCRADTKNHDKLVIILTDVFWPPSIAFFKINFLQTFTNQQTTRKQNSVIRNDRCGKMGSINSQCKDWLELRRDCRSN